MKNYTFEQAEIELKEMQRESIAINCEGLVVKLSHAKYETTGKRSGQWVKLKNIGLVAESLADTLDLVPIGAYYGKGVRRGIFGSYLLASYNHASGLFESACKVGTGLKADELKSLNSHF